MKLAGRLTPAVDKKPVMPVRRKSEWARLMLLAGLAALVAAVNLYLAARSVALILGGAPAVDWQQYVEASRRITGGGDLYEVSATYAFRYSPLIAYLFAPLSIISTLGWRLLHFAAALALPSWPLRIVTLVAWPFWYDVETGNVMVFVLLAAAWALKGSRFGTAAFLAMTLLIPRPLMLPVAAWLLWQRPESRIPFAAAFVLHAIAVAGSGWGAEWISAMLTASGDVGLPSNVGPSRFIGTIPWLIIGGTVGHRLDLEASAGAREPGGEPILAAVLPAHAAARAGVARPTLSSEEESIRAVMVSRIAGLRSALTSVRRRLAHGQTRRFLVAAALAYLVLRWFLLLTSDDPLLAVDAYTYWSASIDDPYPGPQLGLPGAYLYSPAFLQALTPLRLLPWEAFHAIWAAFGFAALVYLVGPVGGALAVTGLPFVYRDLLVGNIHLLLAAAIVVGVRHPAAWAFPMLTKVTPGIGVLYFAGRRDWGSLLMALGVTAAIGTVSFAAAPHLWWGWFQRLGSDTGTAGSLYLVIFVARTVLGAVLILYAGWRGTAWIIPIAVLLALPILWPDSLAILLASFPLLAAKHTRAQSRQTDA